MYSCIIYTYIVFCTYNICIIFFIILICTDRWNIEEYDKFYLPNYLHVFFFVYTYYLYQFFFNLVYIKYLVPTINFDCRPTGYGEKCITYTNVSEAFREACRGVLNVEPGTNDLTDIQLDNLGDVIQETTRILCEWSVCLLKNILKNYIRNFEHPQGVKIWKIIFMKVLEVTIQ